MKSPRGYVLYRGPSKLNGKPLVVIMTLISGNDKIGEMLQTWIFCDNGDKPFNNAQNGEDETVCGDCIHRGKNGKVGSCYVNLLTGPRVIYKNYQEGKYPEYNHKEHKKLIAGKPLRLGAYGDPAAVPYGFWAKLVKMCPRHTGYTHAWRKCDKRLSKFLMASADLPGEVAEANKAGWRTFRVRLPEQPLLQNEIICPASKEGGQRLSCSNCLACHGAGSGHNVAIIAHGWIFKPGLYRKNLTEKQGLISLEMAA